MYALLLQDAMIERVRDLCQEDEQLVAAMMYGSFTRGEGDAYSDIEFVLFFRDDALLDVDQEAWVGRIAPVELYFTNEFGNGTAIFSNLIRVEFHFEKASDMQQVEGWATTDTFPNQASTLLLDRTGRLGEHLRPLIGLPPKRDSPEQVRFLCDSFTNWILFGRTVLMRGELARSLEILSSVQRYLLWMSRLEEQATQHWPTPARALEQEISAAAYARYTACTSPLDRAALTEAYAAAWAWGRELMSTLAGHYNIALPKGLHARLDERLLEGKGTKKCPGEVSEALGTRTKQT